MIYLIFLRKGGSKRGLYTLTGGWIAQGEGQRLFSLQQHNKKRKGIANIRGGKGRWRRQW